MKYIFLILKAIGVNNTNLVRYLIEKGVNVKQENQFGCNIFHETAKYNNPEIIKLIAKKFEGIFVSSNQSYN